MINKQTAKQLTRRIFGEPYVGKRLKQRSLSRVLADLALAPHMILDAGCEDATFTYWLADRYPRAVVTGIDVDAAALAACMAARPSKYAERVRFETSMFADLTPQSFDLVAAFDVLEHIEDDRAAVAQLFAATRPGGRLLVHVPRDRWRHADGRIEIVPDNEAWRINEGHVRMGYSPESLCQILTNAGFEIESVDCWLRRWGVAAFSFYERVERVVPARLLSLPVTDLAEAVDQRRPVDEGNTVFVVARRPSAPAT